MSRGHLILEHAIDQVHPGISFRHDAEDDLDGLCESIERIGLIHPPAVTEQYSIIDGKRRLAALRRMGARVTPLWIVHGVSDALSQVLAIRDEEILRKALKPIEQASLYEELKALYAEEAERRKEATQFGAPARSEGASGEGEGGGADSAPPVSGNDAKSRVQAARAVTGRDSRTQMEQISELKRIAADDAEDPIVRQQAAEVLIELNEDGKVNGRYQQVKTAQHLARLHRWAEHPDTPDPVREAARAELTALDGLPAGPEAAKEAGLAVARVTQLAQAEDAKNAGERVGWADVDPLLRQKHAIRRLVDLLRREHGWWERADPTDVGRYADEEQWQLISSYIDGATDFYTTAQTARNQETGNVAKE
ncbi:ParB N-terminal domain-containing protein [Brevibacterium casei]|uniref:ParB-like N-terminal domain-containing protein n=1 Tax=Brevibacterium ammoniilyticum TaxID=1046555 RepID=A0ABP9U1T3_9MICO|nr:ParB N-terminal domain-containing protein [Brevibacterium casei]QQT68749.1 ParB N-terminal domain-containing protein [Brevibacterium casei]